MKPRSRPSGSQKFFASSDKTKTDFSEKNRLVVESVALKLLMRIQSFWTRRSRLARRELGLLRFKRLLRAQLELISPMRMVARVSGL